MKNTLRELDKLLNSISELDQKQILGGTSVAPSHVPISPSDIAVSSIGVFLIAIVLSSLDFLNGWDQSTNRKYCLGNSTL